ncbi:hypothetical protein [Brachyspira alvinipulli]|uniref:hypothetical protein n=1 Tax=Brachyspira alvinipulli TaxID=84379 RepID=UPI00047F785E|nr:hypothetical protein [Brachyspira alvinipulli]
MYCSIIYNIYFRKKTRVGYLGEFKFDEYHINRTLELNGLIDVKENYKVDGKLDKEALINFIFTNEYITNYSYGFRLQYYNKVFRNSDIYGVYVDTNKVLKDNPFIKEIIMNENGSPFGDLVSIEKIDFEKIDNIDYILKLKQRIINILIVLFLFIIFIRYILHLYKLKSKENIKYNYNIHINKKDTLFLLISFFICILLFIFQYWLSFPGYFQYPDSLSSMSEAITLYLDNWHPLIISLFLNILYKLFGYNTYYILFLNLSLWYIGIYLITISLYLKYKNKLFVLLLFTGFLANLFFLNINHIKDVTSSLWIWCLCSLIFFSIIIPLQNKYINILSIIFLIVGMLWRHNSIVTIYPIFIMFSYLILKDINFDLKNYLLSFIRLMIIFAITLIIIYLSFPAIFKTSNYGKYATNHLFLLQISACAVLSNDDSMIPKEWYADGKTFDNVKKLYYLDPCNGDVLGAPWAKEAPFIRGKELPHLKSVWLKYILKYPFSYIKHISNFAIKLYTINTWKINVKDIQINNMEVDFSKDIYNLFKHDNYVSFTPIKNSIYSFLYEYLPDINILFFIVLSAIIFLLSLYFIIFKNKIINIILLFSFSTSFSAIATALIINFV